MEETNESGLCIGTEIAVKLQHAYEGASPRECCGFLVGIRDGDCLQIRRVIPVLNAVSTSGGYAIPDHESRRVRALAQEEGNLVLAVYHSHPCGHPQLSDSDHESLLRSDLPWVIVTHENNGAIELTGYAARTAVPLPIFLSDP